MILIGQDVFHVKKTIRLALIAFAFVLAVLYDYLVWNKSIGIGLVLFNLIFVFGFYILITAAGHLKKSWPFFLLAPIIILNLDLLLYDNMFVTHLVPPAIFILSLALIIFITVPSDSEFALRKLFLFRYPHKLIRYFRHLSDETNLAVISKGKNFEKIILGAVIAVPLLVIFWALFISADQIFFSWFNNFFYFISGADLTLLWRIIRTFLFFGVLGSLFLFLVSKEHSFRQIVESIPSPINTVTTTTVVSLIAVLFLFFVGAQIKYLFGGEAAFLGRSVTYAEYARQGFFQLLFAAILVSIIVLVIHRQFSHHKYSVGLKSSLIVLLLLTLVVGASALKRNWLYQSAYGLSEIRLYSEWLNWFIAALLIFGVPTIIFNVQFKKVWHGLIVLLVGVFTVTASINADGIIATVNINRFLNEGKKLDIEYLQKLSHIDIIEPLILLDKKLSGSIGYRGKTLTNIFNGLREEIKNRDQWQEIHLGANRAKRLLE